MMSDWIGSVSTDVSRLSLITDSLDLKTSFRKDIHCIANESTRSIPFPVPTSTPVLSTSSPFLLTPSCIPSLLRQTHRPPRHI